MSYKKVQNERKYNNLDNESYGNLKIETTIAPTCFLYLTWFNLSQGESSVLHFLLSNQVLK